MFHKLFLAGLMLATTVNWADAQLVSQVRMKFHTTNDDREGGIVRVEIWSVPQGQPARIVASYEFAEKPVWKDRSPAQQSIRVNRFLPVNTLVARVILRDAREHDIS